MNSETDRQFVSFMTGLVLGAVIGAGVALLTTQESGRKNRKRFKRAAGEIRGSATDRFDDIASEVRDKVDDALRGARRHLES
jgi:gas vesicle protein